MVDASRLGFDRDRLAFGLRTALGAALVAAPLLAWFAFRDIHLPCAAATRLPAR